MRVLNRAFSLSLLGAVIVACDDGAGPVDGSSLVGPCVHTLEDEVLHIDDAAGTITGAVIGQIDLFDFRVDGQPRTADQITQQRAVNVFRYDGVLRCTLPCSFGTEGGEWEFTATAVGYIPTPQTVDAEYETFSGGCPSFETDGTHISISVNEETR